jgi:lysyl-tRNA synthetase class 2
MPSTAIARIVHDQASHELEVTFTSGRRYVYFDVPRAEYFRFCQAQSKGPFFNQHIRDRYDFIERPSRPPAGPPAPPIKKAS